MANKRPERKRGTSPPSPAAPPCRHHHHHSHFFSFFFSLPFFIIFPPFICHYNWKSTSRLQNPNQAIRRIEERESKIKRKKNNPTPSSRPPPPAAARPHCGLSLSPPEARPRPGRRRCERRRGSTAQAAPIHLSPSFFHFSSLAVTASSVSLHHRGGGQPRHYETVTMAAPPSPSSPLNFPFAIFRVRSEQSNLTLSLFPFS